MSAFHWFTKQFVPARIYAAMEAESRLWVLSCPCGYETSVWEMGGIRYKAAGNPWRAARCAACGQKISGNLQKVEAQPG